MAPGVFTNAGVAVICNKLAAQHAQSAKIKAWRDRLASQPTAGSHTAVSTDQLAEYIVLATLGLRDQASDVQQLRSLFALQ